MRTVLLVVAAIALSAVAVDVNCNVTISDTKNHHSYNFDLSPLHHPDNVYIDSLWYRTSDNNIYYINFCGQTASACDDDDTSVCLRLPDGEDYKYVSTGSTTTQTASLNDEGSPDKSVVVTYSKGSQCGSGTYTTKIVVACQPDADPGFFHDIDESDECSPILYMFSASGCGKDTPYVDPSDDSSGKDGGEIFSMAVLIILSCSVVLYFAIGGVYMWKVKEAQTFEEFVIHREFWCSLPSLIKDGFLFIIHGCKKGDYVSI